MKALFALLAVMLFLFMTTITAYAQGKTFKLTVFVPDIAKRVGKLYVGLAKDDATFTGSSWKTVVVDVAATGETVATFENVPVGTYAVRLYQDLNGNKELDRSGMMPSEPFGFSKIAMLMGPPVFREASFELTEDTRMKVLMMNEDN